MNTWNARIRTAMARATHLPDDEVVEELAQHAQAMHASARADGASVEEANARVERQIALWCEDAMALKRRSTRVEPRLAPMDSASRFAGVFHDVRYASRLLRRKPAATLVSVLTMALGIGATTVLFSVAWGVLLKPLPWPEADRLVRIAETREGSTRTLPAFITNGTFLAWKEAPSTLEELTGWMSTTVTVTGAGAPQRVRTASATPTLFSMMRARAEIGTVFTEAPEHQETVVLSHGFWQQSLGGRTDVLGRVVEFDGRPRTVIGVMPAGFTFPDRETRAWLPLRVQGVVGDNPTMRRIMIFSAIGRLKPGVTPQQAADEATARGRGAPDPGLTAIAIFGSKGPVTVRAVPVLEQMTAEVRPALIAFLIAVGLLLATATANVASVQLARATTRRREMAVRAALGAGGARLARQLLVENVLLGLIGGVAGIVAAWWLHRALPSVLPPDFPRVGELALDYRVAAVSLAIALCASIAVGLLPVLHARRLNLVESLSEDALAPVGASGRTKTARARAAIMAGQVAVAAVLLVGASLLIRTFVAMLHADRGYDVSNVLTARVPMPSESFTAERRAALLDRVLERLSATPGVTRAAFTTVLPLMSGDAMMALTLPPPPGGTERIPLQTSFRVVSPDYLDALGIKLVAGRNLSETDSDASQPVVLVNRTFARRYLNDRAIGYRLPANLTDGKPDWEIVGIVDDVRMRGATDPPQPEMFVSYRQIPGRADASEPLLVIRTSGDPAAFVPTLHDIVRQEDRTIALEAVTTMEQRLQGSLARPYLYAVLLGAFAAFALLIAAVGLFGVLSYTVALRSREIAVRSALGARPSDIARLVLRQGMSVTVAGLIGGLLASLWMARSMGAFLYGVAPFDPVTYVAVPAVLCAVAAMACYLPARRAATIDPLRVLKAG